MSEKTPVSVVNDLVEVCKDAEKGFNDAAKDVREQTLKDMFLAQSRQMGQFGKSLEEQVVRLGGKPAHGGSVAGTLHRTWMDIRAVVNLHNAKLVVQECERGETAILSHYEHALQKGKLPQDVKDIVEKQFVEILMTKNRLREIERPEESKEKPKTYSPMHLEEEDEKK